MGDGHIGLSIVDVRICDGPKAFPGLEDTLLERFLDVGP
jgi:hypothetical protein